MQHEIEVEKFPVLHLIAKIYRGLAWVTFPVFIYAVKSALYSGFTEQTLVLLIKYVIGGVFIFISLLAISEGIQVFLAIEKNTRKEQKLPADFVS